MINMAVEIAQANGHRPVLLKAGQWIDDMILDPRHLHLCMLDTPRSAPNVINTVPGYIRGFWYFDRNATRNNSSIRDKKFNAFTINDQNATEFMDLIRSRTIANNQTKFAQAARRPSVIIPDSITIFAQDFNPPRYHKHFLSAQEMIDTAIENRAGRAIYIKPHPNQTSEEMADLRRYHAPENQIWVTDASIHDLMENAALTLSQSSATGFEGYLHHTPAILCGETDFHHIATTCKTTDALASALAQPVITSEYDRYAFWFLRKNLFMPRRAVETRRRILKVYQQMGFDFSEPETPLN
ncbi:hypothetical protein GCM10007939_08930 [Amylibacter marinus]|uniref:Capsule polysaccharide biosynthesis protein n=2 Tax=Amylibacter marinus TaxID=1475483 RepID=A0ABQ5VT63_9RHOB|nr:hypothetical protein GCM10007939_08930 [Amylibacter marinus]